MFSTTCLLSCLSFLYCAVTYSEAASNKVCFAVAICPHHVAHAQTILASLMTNLPPVCCSSAVCSPEHANAYLGPPGRHSYAPTPRTDSCDTASDVGDFAPSTLRPIHHRRGSSSRRGSHGNDVGSVARVLPFPVWPPAVPAEAVPAVSYGDMTVVADDEVAGVDVKAFAEVRNPVAKPL